MAEAGQRHAPPRIEFVGPNAKVQPDKQAGGGSGGGGRAVNLNKEEGTREGEGARGGLEAAHGALGEGEDGGIEDQRVFVLEQAHLAHYIVEPTIRANVDARMSGRVQKREARREQTMFAEGPISCAMMTRAWPSCLSSLLRVE